MRVADSSAVGATTHAASMRAAGLDDTARFGH
jgi:hypothetical protein